MSGSSHKGSVKYGIDSDLCDGVDVDICPDLLLAGIAVAAAAAFFALYTALTMEGRRKRRSLYEAAGRRPVPWSKQFDDLYLMGIF